LEPVVLKISNLDPNTTYTIYVTTGSDQPDYPDLYNEFEDKNQYDTFNKFTGCTTEKLPESKP
jgi:hypothetical protein